MKELASNQLMWVCLEEEDGPVGLSPARRAWGGMRERCSSGGHISPRRDGPSLALMQDDAPGRPVSGWTSVRGPLTRLSRSGILVWTWRRRRDHAVLEGEQEV